TMKGIYTNISRFLVGFFLACIVITIRFFRSNESEIDEYVVIAFIVLTVIAFISAIINFKLNR
ncbi:MAG: hypothetical protein KBD57_09350, partial [Bacteroidia bacterium]|nr:hypothetical protein [Bacteroidia bacterium]